ncbi:MAG TPA: SDR family NAD(P)-dependent oxidoreductase [Candidatus Micrarchaeia archaeon]|nr:SDR family NAD(P)-dependent oxidoreductase [Candidatus Micrarchaeia archaeon]
MSPPAPAGAFALDGHVGVVTGAANGLGRAITEALLAAGARVVAVDATTEDRYAGRDGVVTVGGDVADPSVGERSLAVGVERFGRVDLLVNDAAEYPDGGILEMDPAAWQRVWDVNVTGLFHMTRAFVRHRLATSPTTGAIVNVSSGSARSPRPGGGAYAASKAAVESLSRTHAMELGPHGIRVNVVAPGYIDVRGWSEAHPERAPEALRAQLVAQIPLGEAGRPGDVADAVCFLCSRQARHVSGAVLDVDGGSIAGRFQLRRG